MRDTAWPGSHPASAVSLLMLKYKSMNPMASARTAEHSSVRLHRKQVWIQILLPILLLSLGMIALIVLISMSTFRGNGDVARWAAISTIWLLIPVMLAGLIVLVLLIAIVYLLIQLNGRIPPYSYLAQRFVYRIEDLTKQLARMVRRPVLILQQIWASIRARLAKT